MPQSGLFFLLDPVPIGQQFRAHRQIESLRAGNGNSSSQSGLSRQSLSRWSGFCIRVGRRRLPKRTRSFWLISTTEPAIPCLTTLSNKPWRST